MANNKYTYLKKKAFTLTELIIVIVVIGILGGLAMPKLIGSQRDAHVATLYRDIDTLDKSIQMYFNDKNGLPIAEQITLDASNEAFKQITSTGDSGNSLYKIDLSKLADYQTKLKHGYNKTSDDYFVYSTESNQVFYVKGEQNGADDMVYGLDISPIRNVTLNTTSLSANIPNSVVEGSYVLSGETKSNETLTITVNGINVPVTYENVTYNSNSGIFLDNAYASNSYKKFIANVTINVDTKNIIEVQSTSIKRKYEVYGTKNSNRKPVAVISNDASSTIDSNTNIIWSYSNSTDPDNDKIVAAEWQVDNALKTSPNGMFTAGNHTIQLRVQDEKGAWSDWVNKDINVTPYIAFQTVTFTNANATGTDGPTQNQINTSYTGTSLEGQVTSKNGIQIWTIHTTGTYHIETYGASGCENTYSNRGAIMKGDFSLSKGDILRILVGQKGSPVGGGGGVVLLLLK